MTSKVHIYPDKSGYIEETVFAKTSLSDTFDILKNYGAINDYDIETHYHHEAMNDDEDSSTHLVLYESSDMPSDAPLTSGLMWNGALSKTWFPDPDLGVGATTHIHEVLHSMVGSSSEVKQLEGLESWEPANDHRLGSTITIDGQDYRSPLYTHNVSHNGMCGRAEGGDDTRRPSDCTIDAVGFTNPNTRDNYDPIHDELS